MLWDLDHVCLGVIFGPLQSTVTPNSRSHRVLAPLAQAHPPGTRAELLSHPEFSSYIREVDYLLSRSGYPNTDRMKPFLPANYSLLKRTFFKPALDFNKIILLPNLSTNKMIENVKHMPAIPHWQSNTLSEYLSGFWFICFFS